MIGDGTCGRLLPPFDSPSEWARVIVEVTACEAHYAFLSEVGFDRTRAVLSWTAWSHDVVRILEKTIRQRQPLAA